MKLTGSITRLGIFLLAVLSLMFTSCGSSDDNSSTNSAAAVTAAVPIPPSVPAPLSNVSCPLGYADLLNGITRCHMSLMPPFPETMLSFLDFPRLTPNSGNGNLLVQPFQVFKGDRILFSGSGRYGDTGFLNWCDNTGIGDTEITGFKNGIIQYHGVQPDDGVTPIPAGLVAEVSGHFYSIASPFGSSSTLLLQGGILNVGINSPFSSNCWILGVNLFEYQHCTDATGNTVDCP